MPTNDTGSGMDYLPWGTFNFPVKARPGRLAKVVVSAAVTGNLTFYDNATAGTGTILCQLVTPVVGPPIVIDVPAKYGIYCVGPTAGAGIVVFS